MREIVTDQLNLKRRLDLNITQNSSQNENQIITYIFWRNND